MELATLSSLAKIVTSIASVLILTISASVAVFLYKWQKQSAKVSSIQKLHDDLQFYNKLVLDNEELQEIEAKNHRWGAISKRDVKRMYRYFILFNTLYTAYESRNIGAISASVYHSQINTLANTTYDDREFIKQHVFPRGYENGFRSEVIGKWRQIDSTGTLPNA